MGMFMAIFCVKIMFYHVTMAIKYQLIVSGHLRIFGGYHIGIFQHDARIFPKIIMATLMLYYSRMIRK